MGASGSQGQTFPTSQQGRPDAGASANAPERCHFLRTIGAEGRLGPALEEAALTHRCAAFGEPLPLSLRQQELVCLQRVHVSCPRYLRGALLASEASPAPRAREQGHGISKMTVFGVLLLLASAALGAAIMTGLLPTLRGSSSSPVAVVSASPTDEATPSPSETVEPSVSPSPSLSPTPAPTPEPWPTCQAGKSANRYICLKPCQDEPSCYVYLIRDVRETVKNLGAYFGVSVTAIRNMNPWLGPTGEPVPGQTLRLPPPTLP
jgi:hypothetical protein